MTTRIEMLENSPPSSSMTDSDLVAACESDKVAASRAMSQNAKLKDQVEELELAVVTLVSFDVLMRQ